MALLYLDTSALVKIYVNELGSQRMRQLALPSASNEIAISGITPVEFHSAIRRRQRAGNFDAGEADRIVELFTIQLTTSFLRTPVEDREFDLAIRLIARHLSSGIRRRSASRLPDSGGFFGARTRFRMLRQPPSASGGSGRANRSRPGGLDLHAAD